MGETLRVRAPGADRLAAALRAAAAEMADLGLDQAGARVAAAARAGAPARTGRLRGSISLTGGGQRITIRAGVRYAGYVHDGTSRIRPRPYLTQALAHTQGETMTIVATHIQQALARAHGTY